MDSVFTTAFQEELQKVGIALPAASVAVPVAIGTALSGVALYDLLKSKKLDPKITKEFITGTKDEQVTSSKAVKELLKEKPLIRPVVSVTSDAAIKKMMKDPKFGYLTRQYLEDAAKNMVNKADNAAVIQGEDKDYVIIPKKSNPRVVEHEIGHLQDFARKLNEQPGLLKRLLSLVWKPEYEKQIMERERRAWKYTKKTPLKEQALKSYERGFHKQRAGLAVPAAAYAFLRALKHVPKGGMA